MNEELSIITIKNFVRDAKIECDCHYEFDPKDVKVIEHDGEGNPFPPFWIKLQEYDYPQWVELFCPNCTKKIPWWKVRNYIVSSSK